jgi:acid phosphatase family membrane protein YuiD
MDANPAWYHNIALWTALASWLAAQTMKMLVTLVETKRIDFAALLSTGGMPSAHSAMACGLATTVGLESGFETPLFATTLAFAVVVMFDAQSVRRAAGLQARLLNQIVEELFRNHKFSEEKMAEFLGHTRLEVFLGMLTGITIAIGTYAFFGY